MRELSLDTLGLAVKDYLKDNPDQSPRDLAKSCGISHTVIYALLKGEAANTRLDIALNILHKTGHVVLVFKDWK